MVSTLVNLAEKYDSDISFCGFINRYENGSPDVFVPIKIKSAQPPDAEKIVYMRILDKIMPHLCSTLFKKGLLVKNNIRSYDGCTACQDRELQLKAFCCAKKFSFSPECLYIYVHGAEMGWIRDNNTFDKKLRRKLHSNEAHYRIAEYLSIYGQSKKIKFIANNMLMPEAMIKKFTIYSKANDKENFKLLLNDKKIIALIKKSWKVFLIEPSLFFKAFLITHAPNLYFNLRKGNL